MKRQMKRQWLIELRGERKQEDVAAEAGINRSFYTAIELGIRNPSVQTAMKIARVLGFQWTRFFQEESSGRDDDAGQSRQTYVV